MWDFQRKYEANEMILYYIIVLKGIFLKAV